MSAKFEIYKDRRGEFRFRLKAGNGEPILASEGYTTKSACKNGIASVKKNARSVKRFDMKTAKNGKTHFVLKAGNHQVIGTSQMYTTSASAKNGSKSVGKSAGRAKIEDQT